MRRRWIWPAAVIAVLLLLLSGFLLVRGIVTFLNGGFGGNVGADPMFAEPAERVTRPPELDAGATAPPMPDDPSRYWRYETLTPVDPPPS